MNRIILFLVIGLMNFYCLAKGGLFQLGAFIFFLLVILAMLSELFSRAKDKTGKGE